MTGFVYAMTAVDGRVKVGWSSDPIRRLTKISTDSPSPVQLVGMVPATKKQEAELLSLLAPWRAHRDWFRPEGAVLEFMRLLPRPAPKAKRWDDPGVNAHPIIRWRYENHMTLQALAKRLGTTHPTVSRWENNLQFPAHSFWEPIRQVTGISIATLAEWHRDRVVAA